MFNLKAEQWAVYFVKKVAALLTTTLTLTLSTYAIAHTTCHEALTGDFSYVRYASPDKAVARENSTHFKKNNEENDLVFGKHKKLSAFHMLRRQERFPPDAPLHAVIFDHFGYNSQDFRPAQNKIRTLSRPLSSESIPMGAEAFSPLGPLQNAHQVASWMKEILLDVQNQRPDGRPVVVYVRGALAEGAALLSKMHPELVSSLVVENPLNALSLDNIPEWNASSFGVPTFIVTGTHNINYSSTLKQKIYDLSKAANDLSKKDPHATPVHFLDMPFADSDVFATTSKNISHNEIHRFFRKHLLQNNQPETETLSPEQFVELAQSTGIGSRRFFGHTPKPTPENEINAIQSGVLMWEIGLKAVRSVEEALAHIEKLRGVKEKPSNHIINNPLFFISDSPHLESLNSSPNLESALSLLPPHSALELIQNAANKGHKFFFIDDAGQIQEFDSSKILNVPAEAVYAGDSKNGFMFNISGWTLPTIRGVINLERATQSSAYKSGHLYYNGAYDRKGNITSKGLVHEGYTFEKNKNLTAVLEKLRNMQRKGQSENATRFLDPYNIVLMQRLYEANLLDTLELYNEKGELIAGGLIVKIENVWSPETIFYPYLPDALSTDPNAPLSQRLQGIDFGKAVISQMINEGIRLGHTEFDSQIASSLTIMFGATYVSTDGHFLPTLKESNAGWAERQRIRQESEAQRQAIIDQNFADAAPVLEALKLKIENARKKHTELKAQSVLLQESAKNGTKTTAEQKADAAYMEKLNQERESRKAVYSATSIAEGELRALEEELRKLEYELHKKGFEEKVEETLLPLEELQKAFEIAQDKAKKAADNSEKFKREADALEAEAQRLEELAQSAEASGADKAAADKAQQKAQNARKIANNVASNLKQALENLSRATVALQSAQN